MKTPREILLSRHQNAEPKLDTIRAQAVGNRHQQNTRPGRRADWLMPLFLRLAALPWRQLILPNPRVWAGLAAVWIALILVNVLQRDPAANVPLPRALSPSVMASWQIQPRWMNELFADRTVPVTVDRPRNTPSRPRSEETRGLLA